MMGRGSGRTAFGLWINHILPEGSGWRGASNASAIPLPRGRKGEGRVGEEACPSTKRLFIAICFIATARARGGEGVQKSVPTEMGSRFDACDEKKETTDIYTPPTTTVTP